MRLRIRQQRGYALILTVLAFMGLGGVVISGFTQQARKDVEQQRYEHNQRVLKQAKQALLMLAYNYPVTTGGGPGRMPCPDTDNDGFVNPATCGQVGRFPWRDARLNVHQTLDASGEMLWYAVSSAFDNVAGGGIINSDTRGTLTLLDQTGGVLYDGAVGGIAAILIAPGPVLERDENNDGSYEYSQIRDTALQQQDPRNYLDTLFVQGAGANNEIDNSVFTNSESDTNDDGFILGPVFDANEGRVVVNDQMIIITADEVIEMAEMAVLETYAREINAYQTQFWGVPANQRFPWLSAYDDTTTQNWDAPAGTGVNMFDARPGETTGRVPFLDYYQDYDSHSVVSDLQIDFDATLTYTSMVDNLDPFDPTYIDVFSTLFTGFPAGVQTVDISRANLTFSKTTFDGATDITTDNLGTLISQTGGTATVIAAPTRTVYRYFWDGCPTCFEPADGWELCPVDASPSGEDCARNITGAAYVPFTNWNNHADVAIRLVKMTLTVDPDFVIELDYDPAPTIGAPNAPTAGANANFSATFNVTEIADYSVADLAETNTRNFIDLVVVCDQDNYVGSGLNLYELGNENAGTVLCATNLVTNTGETLNNQFVITADYYPQLPRWVAENNWDDAVMMSYAPDFGPDGGAVCVPEDGDTGTGAGNDCLVVSNMAGVNNDITAILVLAGEHDLVDGDDLNDDGDWADADEVAPDNDFSNDLYDIFEPENYSGIGPDPVPNSDPDPPSDTELGLVFDKREDVVTGNAADTLFVIN